MDAPSGSRMKYVILMTCLTLVPAQQQPPATTSTSTTTSSSSSVDCFTSSNIVGAVLGTFFATSIILALIFFALWWVYCRRRSSDDQNKGGHAVESGPGFDNPCFETHPQSDVVDSSKTAEDGRKDVAKSTSWTPLRFFGNSRSEKRSMDDSFISEPERVSVQLRGHDFTGLGFNVTGNMRDGIFIKDILNRGPAFESGKIAPGDKILSVTISFRHVVYEDALTILSYASPYDVTMELEKGQRNNSNTLKQRKAASSVSLAVPSSASSATASISPDGAPFNERLVHPLYRSQSIDDLSKVGRTDSAIRANVRIPAMSGHLSGSSLARSKLLTKANIEMDSPVLPDAKIKSGSISKPSANVMVDAEDITLAPSNISLGSKASKFSKFGIKVLPDLKLKSSSSKSPELVLTNLPTGLATPEVELNLPKVEIHTPKSTNVAIDIDLPDGQSLRQPSGNLPVSINIPELPELGVSANVNPPDVSVDIDAPSMGLSSDFSGPEFGINAPKISQPNVDVVLPSAKVNLEMDLPNVPISQKAAVSETSFELPKTDMKSGFHLKFPKFGANKSVKIDGPEGDITASAPAVDVSLPDVNIDLDPKLKKEGASAKAGFEFKMPKLSMKKQKTDIAVDMKATPVSVDAEAPGLRVDVQSPTLEGSVPVIEPPSLTMEAKKPKMGFSMPKWNLGKGQGDAKESSVELSLETPTVRADIPHIISDEEDAEGIKKKSKFSLKMPKMPRMSKGELDASLPEIGAEVSYATTDDDDESGEKKTTKKLNIKGPKLPKAEATIDLSLPSVEMKDDSDADVSSKKKGSKFGLKMPKFSRDEVDVSLAVPNVSVDVKHEDTSSDDEEESTTAAKKKSKKFGFKIPKMSTKGEADVNLALPSISAEVNQEEMPQVDLDVNLAMPKISAEVKDHDTDDDGTAKKKLSLFHLKKPKIPKGEVDVDVNLPKISTELKSPTSDDSDDEGTSSKKQSSSKFNVKIPSLPKGEAEVTLALPKVEVSKQEGESDEEGGAGKKKSGKFSLKMPKWNVNKAHSEVAVLEGVEGKIQMGADIDSLALPSGEMRMSDIGSDTDDDGTRKRGKFSIKMPKFGMNKPTTQVQVEGSDISAELELPKVNTEANIEVDTAKIEGKKKSMFGFKMPKMGGTATLPEVNVHLEEQKAVEVELPTLEAKVEAESSTDDEADHGDKKKKRFHLKMPKFGSPKAHLEADLPKLEASIEQTPRPADNTQLEVDLSAPKLNVQLPGVAMSRESESDDDSEDGVKKKTSFGMKLPKLGFDKPQGTVDLKLGSASKTKDSSSDDEDKPTKTFGVTMPDFNLGVGGDIRGEANLESIPGEIQVTTISPNVNLPKIEAEATDPKERKKGTKFGIKLPGLNFEKPKVDLGVDIHHSATDSSSDEENDAKEKSKFSLKMPNISLPKPSAEADIQIETPKIPLPAVKLEGEVKAPSLNLEIEGSQKEEGGEKEATSFDIKMPKLSLSKHLGSAELKADSSIAAPKLGIDVNASPNLEVEAKVPELDVNLQLPKVDIEAIRPKGELGLDLSDGEGDDKKKKHNKFGIKMPKFHMKKKTPGLDLDIEKDVSIRLDTEATNVAADSDSASSDDEAVEKKKSKFAIKLPKFGLKKPHVDVDLPTGSSLGSISVDTKVPIPKLEADETDGDRIKALVDVSQPNVSVVKPQLNLDVNVDSALTGIKPPRVELDTTAFNPVVNVKTPELVLDVGEKKPTIDLNIEGSMPSIQQEMPTLSVDVDQPTIPSIEVEGFKKKSMFGIDMGKLGFTKQTIDVKAGGEIDIPKVPDVNVTNDLSVGASVDIPRVDVDVDIDEDKKKSSKFSFKMPKFHMGKHHSELKVDPKLELPEIAAETNVELPSVEVEAPSVAVNVYGDAESDDEKRDKKKSRFGIKMPKFHMNKPSIPDSQITADGINLDVQVDMPTVKTSLPGAAELELKEEIDIDLSATSAIANPIEVGLDMPEVKIDHPEKESNKKKGKFSFKMPKLHGSSRGDVELPEVKIQAEIPEGEVPEIEVKTDLSGKEAAKKSPFIVKMPELDLIKPGIEMDLSKPKTDQVDSSSDSQSDDDDEDKKKFKLGIKLPQFSMTGKKGISKDVEVPSLVGKGDLPSVELPSIENPDLSSSQTVPAIAIDVKKKSKFGFKVPSLPHGKAHVDISGPESTDINLEKALNLEVHGKERDEDSESSDDEGKKSSHKIDIKVPKFQLRQRGADVVLPQVELKTEDVVEIEPENEIKKEVKIAAKKPKFGIKLPAMPDLHKPQLNTKIDLPQIEVQQPVLTTGASDLSVNLPQVDVEFKNPIDDIDDAKFGAVADTTVVEIPTVKTELDADFDVQLGKISTKKDDDASSSSDSDDEKKTKSSSFHIGLKMPKFSMGKEKHGVTEAKLEAEEPSVILAGKNNGDEVLEIEPIKMESSGAGEKEKKKFNIGLKMPKFPSKTVTVETESGLATENSNAEQKAFKINLKAPKVSKDKKKKKEDSTQSDDSHDEEEGNERELSVAASSKLIDAEVKLPRVQVYKNVEYRDAEKERHQESSSDEDDETKDIKKNIGARFGVKLKKPKMFSSSKVEITGKNDPSISSSATSATLQPEWKLPRVDLRRTSKSAADQELTVDVNLDTAAEQNRLEQLSPSERAEAIRRDSKSSAGIRLHSPSYISQMMPSPRSKKMSLELLDVESSPRLLSVTRLDPTPPIETSATTQPVYGAVQLTASVTAPQVSVSDIPSSVLMASDAVKIKRGPPTPARRSIIDPSSPIFSAPVSVAQSPADVSVTVPVSSDVSGEVVAIAETVVGMSEEIGYNASQQQQQTSDTDISVTTSTGSDTLVIACSPASTTAQQDGTNRKASSLGDLTRIPPSASDDGSLERTVSLDFKPMSTLAGGSSKAIYNLAVQDLSRVGEDSDEDYSLSRKRSTYDSIEVNAPEGITTDMPRSPSSDCTSDADLSSQMLQTSEGDSGDSNMSPIESGNAEALWFGSTNIQTVESVQTTMSYTQLEESVSTDVTLTTTSLGTSPSETSSSSSSSSSDGSPAFPASPEPSSDCPPDLVLQVENGNVKQYSEETEITREEVIITSRTVTMEVVSSSDDPQPQPLTDLNPSAGSFAAVRSRFEQLSSNVNGAEVTPSPSTRSSGLLSQGSVKRLSGNFEDPSLLQKSYVQHLAPEVSEGALSRTVIISSLQLERSEQSSSTVPANVGPESPVPNLEPPC